MKDIVKHRDGTISIKFKQFGESRQYTGLAKLPARATYPMFKTYAEADAYSQSEPEYAKSIENGIEYPSVFKTGSVKRDDLKYVVGFHDDRKHKKLPKGYRWTEIVL